MELLELHSVLWHLAFVHLVMHHKPPNFEVLSEVRLSIEPQRADMILLRRADMERRDHEALVMRQIWPWLGLYTVLEYKSPTNHAFKTGDLQRLYLYGLLWDVNHRDELASPDELTLVLVLASLTPTFFQEIGWMGLEFELLGGGYGRIDGMMYMCYVVVVDEVCEEERDDYLQMFSHQGTMNPQVLEWSRAWMREEKMSGKNVDDMADFDAWYDNLMYRSMQRISVERRLEGLTPEQILSALAPEKILSALAPEKILSALPPEQILLGLPIEALQALPEDYIRTLAPEVQEKILQRRHRQTTTH